MYVRVEDPCLEIEGWRTDWVGAWDGNSKLNINYIIRNLENTILEWAVFRTEQVAVP
jgi:hypothetical protein